jgi:tetratricopeptide (TPR) repeat protein
MKLHAMRALILGATAALTVVCSSPAPVSAPQETAAEYYKLAYPLFQEYCLSEGFEEKGCDKAIEQLEKAIELNPELVDAYLALALAYWNKSFVGGLTQEERAGLRQKAAPLCQKVIAMDPENTEAHYWLASYIGDREERVQLLERVVELDPQHPEAHRKLARVYLDDKRFDEAVEQYLIHMEVSPYRGREDGFHHTGFAGKLAKTGRLKEVAQIYEELLVLTRDESRFERCLLFRSLDVELYAAFKELVATAKKLKPYCTNLEHSSRAIRLENNGKFDDAIREWELQLEENPYYEGTYTSLPNLYLKQGQPEKALEVVTKYFEIDTDPLYRCRQYRTMSRKGYERFAPKIMGQLKKECE